MKAAFNFVCVFLWHLKGKKEQNHHKHSLSVSGMITFRLKPHILKMLFLFFFFFFAWKSILISEGENSFFHLFLYYAFGYTDELLCRIHWRNHKVTVVLSVGCSNRACRKTWSMAICSVINLDLTCRSAGTRRWLNGVAKYAIRIFCNCFWPQLSVLVWAGLV